MKKHYGEFSPGGDQFIIYRADTPQPWLNLFCNGKIASRISQTGGGDLTDLQEGSQALVTPAYDAKGTTSPYGRTVYIRDIDSGEWWIATGAPTGPKLDSYEAVHGPGYTLIQTARNEIDTATRFFLSPTDPCEIWQLTIHNRSNQKRRLSIFAFLEWQCADPDQYQTAASEYAVTLQALSPQHPDKLTRFLGCSQTIDSFDTQKEHFFGRYGSERNPEAVSADGRCGRSIGPAAEPVAVIQKNITLGASDAAEISFFAGSVLARNSGQAAQARRLTKLKDLLSGYRQRGAVGAAWEACRTLHRDALSPTLVKSPEPLVDYFTNSWAKHQARIQTLARPVADPTRLRLLSALVSEEPQTVRRLLADYFCLQYQDGRLPLGSDHADSSHDLVAGTVSYLLETADLAFLEERLTYADGGEASILHHLTRALDRYVSRLSARHLPVLDRPVSLDESPEQETIQCACSLYQNLRSMEPILDAVGEHELAHKYDRLAMKLRDAVNKAFWDGAWFAERLEKGKVVRGGRKNSAASLTLAAQVAALTSGVASPERARKVLAVVERKLKTKFGYRELLSSSATNAHVRDALINPGASGNGAIAIEEGLALASAQALAGEGDRALETWLGTCPGQLIRQPEHYRASPYAYAETIFGPDHPRFGAAQESWVGPASGAAFTTLVRHLLGVQPTLGGLKLDPCIPRDWRHVELTRTFRGAEYHIRIQNALRQQKGVDRILVDGIRITGSVIPIHTGGVHFVEVILG